MFLVTEWINDYLRQFNTRTATVNAQVLREVETHTGKPAHNVTQPDVISYFDSIKGNAPNTIRRKLNTLSGFHNYLIKRGLADRNPVVAVRIPKVDGLKSIRWLTGEECGILVNGTSDTLALAVLYAGLSGLRLAEIASLNVEQYRDGRLWNVEGKGSKVRTVPLTLQAAQAIEDHIGERTRGPLFALKPGQRISPRSVQNLVSRAALEALGRHVNVHALRHSAGTMLAKADVPILKIARILGHRSTAITEIYTHLDDDDLASEVRKLDKPIKARLTLVREETA